MVSVEGRMYIAQCTNIALNVKFCMKWKWRKIGLGYRYLLLKIHLKKICVKSNVLNSYFFNFSYVMRFFHSVYIFVPVPIIHRRDDYLRNSPALRD